MEKEIKHRRLYAFNNSKVLCALTIAMVAGISLLGCCESWLTPLVCFSTALVLYIGYSLWLWFGKPGEIVINTHLSDMRFYLVLYILILSVLKVQNIWWFILPMVCSIILMFVSMLRFKDEVFVISEE